MLNKLGERKMDKKIILAVVVVMLFAFSPAVSVRAITADDIKNAIQNPYELTIATIEGGNPETVDPAWCYDTASAELIMNVYDTLITFDGEHMERYLPSIATEWTIENIPELRALRVSIGTSDIHLR